MSPPAEWDMSPWPMTQFMMVMSPRSPLPSELMEKVSSRPHAKEQWSKIMFVPLDTPAQSRPESPPAPMRKRM